MYIYSLIYIVYLFAHLHPTATQLTNFMFDGARADLSKVLSANPAFQVTHAFTLGSQTQEPSYNFSSLFISDRVRAFFFHSTL